MNKIILKARLVNIKLRQLSIDGCVNLDLIKLKQEKRTSFVKPFQILIQSNNPKPILVVKQII